jgi:hypothetical protein
VDPLQHHEIDGARCRAREVGAHEIAQNGGSTSTSLTAGLDTAIENEPSAVRLRFVKPKPARIKPRELLSQKIAEWQSARPQASMAKA